VSSARLGERTFVPEENAKHGKFHSRIGRKEDAMTIKSNSDEVGPAPNESFYEERASEEEIYLEETEEELRSRLISDTPQDDRPTPAPDTAFELYREVLVTLFQD
jgi:hypothetical protein